MYRSINMMNGTLPRVRSDHRWSLRAMGKVVGKSAAAVLCKLRGERPWTLHEAHAVTAYVCEHFDSGATMDDLFGLSPIAKGPASTEPSVAHPHPATKGD